MSSNQIFRFAFVFVPVTDFHVIYRQERRKESNKANNSLIRCQLIELIAITLTVLKKRCKNAHRK